MSRDAVRLLLTAALYVWLWWSNYTSALLAMFAVHLLSLELADVLRDYQLNVTLRRHAATRQKGGA